MQLCPCFRIILQVREAGGGAFSPLPAVLNRLLKWLVRNQAYLFHIFAKTIPLLNQGQFGFEKNRIGGREPGANREDEADLIFSTVINTGVCCVMPDSWREPRFRTGDTNVDTCTENNNNNHSERGWCQRPTSSPIPMRSRQWFVSAFSLLGKVMSSYLAWGGSCWARADRTGTEGTRTHRRLQWQAQTHKQLFMLTHIYTCLHLPPSQDDNPDGILVTAVTREREGACTANSRLRKTADMQFCVFCVVKKLHEQQYTGSIQCRLKLGSVNFIFGFI